MRRDKKTIKEKEIYKLVHQWNDYWNKQQSMGYEKLDKPIFIGHYMHHVLSPHYEKHPSAHHYKRILDKINFIVYTREKEHPFKNYKYPLYLKILKQKEYDELFEGDNPLPPRFKFDFYKQIDVMKFGNLSIYSYSFNNTNVFVPKIEKHFMDKVRLTDPECQSLIDKLSDKMQAEHVWEKYYGNRKKYDDWFDYGEYNREENIKTLRNAIQEHHQDIGWRFSD